MIHLLAYKVQEHLREKHFPIGVQYGPEGFRREQATNLIVMHREGESDSFAAPSAPGRNPRSHSNRTFGFACLVYAKASKAGARREDHEVLCDVFVNALVCALFKSACGSVNSIVLGPGHLLTAAERAGTKFETFSGVVYELKASLVQSVQDFDWDGQGAPLGLISAVHTDSFTTNGIGEDRVSQFAGSVDVD